MMVIAPKYVGAVLMPNFNVNFKIVFKKIHLCISWLTQGNLMVKTNVRQLVGH
jgi:hypothetical protein